MNNNLREVRKEVGLTVTELAKRVGVSRFTITNIELHRQIPNGSLLLKICRVLNKKPEDIFFEDNGAHEQQ